MNKLCCGFFIRLALSNGNRMAKLKESEIESAARKRSCGRSCVRVCVCARVCMKYIGALCHFRFTWVRACVDHKWFACAMRMRCTVQILNISLLLLLSVADSVSYHRKREWQQLSYMLLMLLSLLRCLCRLSIVRETYTRNFSIVQMLNVGIYRTTWFFETAVSAHLSNET